MLDSLKKIEATERLLKRWSSAPKAKRANRSSSLPAFIAEHLPQHTPIPPHLARLIEALEHAAKTPGTLLLVSMPPRHGKSVTLHAALAWMVWRWPARLNAYITYQADLAKLASRRVRRLARGAGIVFSEDAATLSDWRTPQDGGLSAVGISSGLTGKGFDGLVVIDDPLSGREEAESLNQREKVWETFTDDAFTRLNPGGSIVVVATRWHCDDLIGRLEQQSDPKWQVINLPAVSEEGEALWPERFGLDKLRVIRAQTGEYGWWSLYQGKPRPRGGRVFQLADPPRFDQRSNGARVVLAVDAAGTAGTHSDYTVAIALEFEGTADKAVCNVVDLQRWQDEPQNIAPQLLAFQRKHADGTSLRIEASRDGKSIARALRALQPLLRIAEVPPIGDKFTRAQPVAAAWNQGRVRLPRNAPWIDAFLHELSSFTGLGDRHDDQVDALAHGWNGGALLEPAEDAATIPLASSPFTSF